MKDCLKTVAKSMSSFDEAFSSWNKVQILRVLLLVLLLHSTCCRHIQDSSRQTDDLNLQSLHLPNDPIFQHPWVQNNIAVTYGHKVQDGIGSQTLRMLAVYALSKSLSIGHVFRPLGCVGHIGEHVHYRNTGCNFTHDEAARKQLNKAQSMISLPTTVTGNTSTWTVKFLPALDWTPFVKSVNEALKSNRPTLYEIERVNTLLRYHPDIFLTIPALRPSQPLAPLGCRKSGSSGEASSLHPGRAWLLDALRIAVHIRRGDVITGNWHKRILKTEYFINIVKQITQLLDQASCEYSVEVYIEPLATPEGTAELELLKSSIPNVVLLIDTDMLWSWQMMASADIVVMSNSMFSLSAAVLNPNAVTIHVPYNHYVHRVGMFKMRHWLPPADENGTLPDDVLERIRQRIGVSANESITVIQQ